MFGYQFRDHLDQRFCKSRFCSTPDIYRVSVVFRWSVLRLVIVGCLGQERVDKEVQLFLFSQIVITVGTLWARISMATFHTSPMLLHECLRFLRVEAKDKG